MSTDSLQWLMQWYLAECNNDWEHQFGVEIGTLDNPGWLLKIDLVDTPLEGHTFNRVWYGDPTDNLEEWERTGSWWVVDVKDNRFEASCGPLDLPAVIDLFRQWVASAPQTDQASSTHCGH